MGFKAFSSSPRRSRFSTEQIVPRRKGSCDSEVSDLSNLTKEVLNEDVTLRVLLLSPPPPSDGEDGDDGYIPVEAPSSQCEKSTIDAYSHNGSVTVELIRLAGAEGHHFRLYVTSCEESVHVLLPSEFRGALFISHARSQRPASVEYGAGLRRRIDGGVVRINPVGHGAVAEDEDEVHLYAANRIVVETKNENTDLPGTAGRPLWVLEGREQVASTWCGWVLVLHLAQGAAIKTPKHQAALSLLPGPPHSALVELRPHRPLHPLATTPAVMSSENGHSMGSFEKTRPLLHPSCPTRGTHKVKYRSEADWDFRLDAGRIPVDMSLMLPHYRARHQPIDHRMSMFVSGTNEPIKLKVCRNFPRSQFYLEVLAESSDVTIWLPSDFKGQIHHSGKAIFSSGFINKILRNVRLNEPDVQELYSEDDVVVVTRGRVTFRMWDTQTCSPENTHKECFKRMFGCSQKAPETPIDWDFLIKD
ncbi:hypothetical protein NLJ89_g6277 [Agrocybe chaxingu]|uniref:DUF7330 domain-containing protein n=1 Tax=Agrocybe chaxingu TaxID=84603 RepID=A0A9W8MU76_9AGAR|nr:hypothetical protein NLJ89_g6277 [Agrocybe chaxingu]